MGLPPYRVGSITVKAFIEDKFKYAAHQILRNDTVYDYREAEEVINSLFENMDIGTVTTSTKGRYKYALINGGQRVRAIKRCFENFLACATRRRLDICRSKQIQRWPWACNP